MYAKGMFLKYSLNGTKLFTVWRRSDGFHKLHLKEKFWSSEFSPTSDF